MERINRMQKGKCKMTIVGILFIIIGIILIYWNGSYSPFQNRFVKDMEKRVQTTERCTEVCTREEIANLPEVMQKYCNYIGLEGFPKYQAVRTIFSDTKFVFNDESGMILDMDYDLWLFYDEPFRSAYCKSKLHGIPFDGIDYCTDDLEGGMKGIVGKAIRIFDTRSQQAYQAGLVSWLAESVCINPSAVLSSYVSYEAVDEHHVKATVAYNGVSGSGIFTLNDEGAIIEFYSDDRQVEKIDGADTRIGWKCEYEGYRKENGIMQAHMVRSVKIYPDKEVTYFDAEHFATEYLK